MGHQGGKKEALSGSKNRIRIYAGQYFDAETGLHYNYHRYYDPKLGRYLRADPIGLAGGINPYTYVSNNPVNLIDPYGLVDWGEVGTGSSAIFIGGSKIAASYLLFTASAGEAASIEGLPWVPHTFGAGLQLFISGSLLTAWGMDTVAHGIHDWDARTKQIIEEAKRRAEEESRSQFAEMERQYNRINEWIEKREKRLNGCP